MWTAHFKVFDKENKIMKIVRKNKIIGRYYPVSHYIQNKRYYFISVGLIQGEKENKKAFFRDLLNLRHEKKGRRLELLEVEGDFFILITSHSIAEENKWAVSIAFNPRLLHFNPPTWHEDGWEEWNVASMERKELEKLIQLTETTYKLKLLEFKKKKITNFGFLTMLPEITEKQQKAIEFALKNGYYKYPRESNLDELAKKFGLAFSTFQAHIRKAENKIISFAMSVMKS